MLTTCDNCGARFAYRGEPSDECSLCNGGPQLSLGRLYRDGCTYDVVVEFDRGTRELTILDVLRWECSIEDHDRELEGDELAVRLVQAAVDSDRDNLHFVRSLKRSDRTLGRRP